MPKVYNYHLRNAPKGAVFVGRPSKWGNPFVLGRDGDRAEVVQKYEDLVRSTETLFKSIQSELWGKDLICFCTPLQCHADVLLRVANEGPPPPGVIVYFAPQPSEIMTSFFEELDKKRKEQHG